MTQVPSLGWEDSLEEGMATRFSILAWSIPWTEEPGGLQSMGLRGIRHDLATGHTQCRSYQTDKLTQQRMLWADPYARVVADAH